MKLLSYFKSSTNLIFIGIILFLASYRIGHVDKHETSWDVFGYYLYLPATFVHHDPMLNDIEWIKKANSNQEIAGTLYMISSNDTGEPMYFFLMGMSILYLPFFFIGQIFASLLGYPLNGLSPPYQYALVMGGIIYTVIGLVYLRKILHLYFNRKLTTILLLILVFGTNYIHHLTLKNLETVNFLFTLITILIFHTIRWHENNKLKDLLIIGICFSLIGLIKPTEGLIILFPILWKVYNKQTLLSKIKLIIKFKKQFIITGIICFLIVLPQILYWYVKSGHFIYDTYKNPGVGLDLLRPHLLNTLFSYRKGWLIYTPVMIFALIGFRYFYKEQKEYFFAYFVYFIISFYIISSWSEWWYGAGFSLRPVIALYPILFIMLGFLLKNLKNLKLYIVSSFIILFVFFNQFQWWQLKNYILDTYRTTKEYYWSTFLSTSVTPQERELLMVERSFDGKMLFNNPEKYKVAKTKKIKIKRDLNQEEFFDLVKINFSEITEKDHLWIESKVDYFKSDSNSTLPVYLVVTMENKAGDYGYFTFDLSNDSTIVKEKQGNWKSLSGFYMTPEIRNASKDFFKCYIWNPNKTKDIIKNIEFKFYERK